MIGLSRIKVKRKQKPIADHVGPIVVPLSIPGGMSISTVKFLLLPFSCLTGATPLTGGGGLPLLLPFNSDDVGDLGSSAVGDFGAITVVVAAGDVTASAALVEPLSVASGLLLLTDPNRGDVDDEPGDFATSSSTCFIV